MWSISSGWPVGRLAISSWGVCVIPWCKRSTTRIGFIVVSEISASASFWSKADRSLHQPQLWFRFLSLLESDHSLPSPTNDYGDRNCDNTRQTDQPKIIHRTCCLDLRFLGVRFLRGYGVSPSDWKFPTAVSIPANASNSDVQPKMRR
jgi:hypothetical protein